MSERNYNTITDLAMEYVDGIENPSGISEEAFLVRVSDVITEARPLTTGTTAASILTITGDHILKAGAKVIPCNVLYNDSGAEFKLTGEELSKLFEKDVTLFIPQLTASTMGTAAVIKTCRYLVFLRRPDQLVGFWQIGSKGMSAKPQDIAGGFGTGPTGKPGLKLTLKAFATVPMYDYQGELPAPAGA